MTAQQQVVYGPNGMTGTGLTATLADIIYKVDSGSIDTGLRVIFDAVVERKNLLQSAGSLPPQVSRDEVDATPTLPYGGAVINADGSSTVWSGNTPITPPVVQAPKQVRRKRAPEPRPDTSIPPWNGTIMPVPRSSQQVMDPAKMIHLFGFVYNKSEIVGKYVDMVGSHGGLTFKITGVGPKTLKALVVHEPQPGMRFQNKDAWKAWNTNTPMFLPHSAIQHWLARPVGDPNY